MIKTLKWLAIILAALFLIGAAAIYLLDESEPSGQYTSEADELANQMMASVNKTAWDTTPAVQWTFAGRHDYIWDKQRDFVQVVWGDNTVILHTKSLKGMAYIDGQRVTGQEEKELIDQAWARFCNDSFWLNAVVKAKDPGTKRSIVTLDDGRKGLKVEYTSGGVTPGDAYVWILDENNRPTSYKMWVEIIPVGGLEVTWDDYVQLPTGAWIATSHKAASLDIAITNLKAGSLNDLSQDQEDIFKDLNALN